MKRFKKLIRGGKSSSQEGYQYDELSRGGYFRYLNLQPGASGEPLRCTLHTAHLPKKPLYRTKFEAISYVWGSNVKDKVILCDGRTLNITTNLFEVLQRVRRTDAPRKLWADSICINQADLEEKGYQVANMGQIYRAAESVLIYIGSNDNGHGPRVCSLLDDVNAMIEDTCAKIDMSWDSFPWPEEDDNLSTDTRWHSLRSLMSQQWFRRGWVVREAASAQCGHVLWAQSEFTWESLMRAYVWLRRRGQNMYYLAGFSTCPIDSHYGTFKDRYRSFTQTFYVKQSWTPHSLLNALESAKGLELADPRDRIFAFMELSLTSDRQIHLYPNYKDSHLQIYQHFAIEYTQATNDVHVLDYVAHNIKTLASSTPSWVPHWNTTTYPIGADRLLPGGTLKSRTKSNFVPRVISDVTLEVRGITMDSIQYASEVFAFNSITGELIRSVWNSVKLTTTNSPYEALHQLNVFLETLCVGRFYGELTQWERDKAVFVANSQLTRLDTEGLELSPNSTIKLEKQSSVFFEAVKGFTDNKRFIVTKRGYMGLAPAVTAEGDTCGIIFGTKLPCILRPLAHQDHYRYLGAAFIMGKEPKGIHKNNVIFGNTLGAKESKDWLDWDVEEQDIYLC